MPEEAKKSVVIHAKRRIFQDFFSIDEAEVSFEGRDGRMIGPVRRLSFERGDSVAALVLKKGSPPTVLLVNQFKYPAYAQDGGWITEAAAGMLAPGEAKEAAMKREIVEELGYEVASLEFIATFYPSPGGCSERIHLFYGETSAGDLRPGFGGGLIEEGEDIRILEYTLDDFFRKLTAGQFMDAKLIIAGWWLKSRLAAAGEGSLSS
jgi:nudix-type nucleoside diphosphatase (YffH/AdpP family)